MGSALLSSCVIGSYTMGPSGDEDDGTGGSSAGGGGGEGGEGSCTPRQTPAPITAQVAQGTGPYGFSLPASNPIADGSYQSARGFDAEVSADELTLAAPDTFWGWDELRVPLDDGCNGTVDAVVRLRVSPTSGGALGDGADAMISSLPAGAMTLGAADVDGDGTLDLLVGSPAAEGGKGTVSVLTGRPLFRDQFAFADLGQAELPGFQVVGQTGDELGTAVSTAGDVDCAGRDSMLLGAPGNSRAYLVGRSATSDLDLTTDTAGVFPLTGVASSATGRAVAGGADVNADGIPDLLVGSPDYSTPNPIVGRATVVFGGFAGCDCEANDTCRSSGDLSQINGATAVRGYEFTSTSAGNQVGQRVALLGAVRVNDVVDEFADVGVAASNRVSFVPGKDTTTPLTTAEVTFQTGSGSTVAAAGDFDGDDNDDFVYCLDDTTDRICTVRRGAGPDIRYNAFPTVPSATLGGQLNANPRDDLVFVSADKAWVVFGRTAAGGSTITTDIGFLNAGGYELSGEAGAALTAVRIGDWDGDGFDEVAFGDSTNGTIYIVAGGP